MKSGPCNGTQSRMIEIIATEITNFQSWLNRYDKNPKEKLRMGVPGQNKCLHMQWQKANAQRRGYNRTYTQEIYPPRCYFQSKALIIRFNFALHFVQFGYHLKERLSFISCFFVGQIFVGSWMKFEIEKHGHCHFWSILPSGPAWLLVFLNHDIHISPYIYLYCFYFPFHMEPDPWRSENKLPDYHNASNRANCLSFLLQSLWGTGQHRGYLCSWLNLTLLAY